MSTQTPNYNLEKWDLTNDIVSKVSTDQGSNMDAIDTTMKANETAISNEVTNRTNADTVLQNNVNTETSQRISADNALDIRIDNLIIGSGTSSAEVIDARGAFASVLRDRLDVVSSATNPTNTDDQHEIGKIWVNSVTKKNFILVDNSASNAIWNEVGVDATTSIIDPTVNDDDYALGTLWINTNTNFMFIIVDNTSTSAVWIKLAKASELGDIATLATTDKSSAVNAINEVKNQVNGIDALTTQGDILYRDATGYQRLPYGTAGQKLQTNGASANPSWEDVQQPTDYGNYQQEVYGWSGSVLDDVKTNSNNQLVLGNALTLTTGFNSYTGNVFASTGMGIRLDSTFTANITGIKGFTFKTNGSQNPTSAQTRFSVYDETTDTILETAFGTVNGKSIVFDSPVAITSGNIIQLRFDMNNITQTIGGVAVLTSGLTSGVTRVDTTNLWASFTEDVTDNITGTVDYIEDDVFNGQATTTLTPTYTAHYGYHQVTPDNLNDTVDRYFKVDIYKAFGSVDLIPVMTSNTTPSGVASASSVSSASYDAWCAMNDVVGGGVNEYWNSGSGLPQWLSYQFTSAKVIGKYSIDGFVILSSNQPNSWTFEGSNNGVDWNVLDTVTGETGWGTETREYTFDNSTAYLYYRINITALNGSSSVVLCNISMFEARELLETETYTESAKNGVAQFIDLTPYSTADYPSLSITHTLNRALTTDPSPTGEVFSVTTKGDSIIRQSIGIKVIDTLNILGNTSEFIVLEGYDFSYDYLRLIIEDAHNNSGNPGINTDFKLFFNEDNTFSNTKYDWQSIESSTNDVGYLQFTSNLPASNNSQPSNVFDITITNRDSEEKRITGVGLRSSVGRGIGCSYADTSPIEKIKFTTGDPIYKLGEMKITIWGWN